MLTPHEEKQLIAGWNDTFTSFPGQTGVHKLFEEQAAEFPEAVALVQGDVHITFRELDRRSSLLACRLQAIGVQRDGIVGVYTQRSPEMLVALLAVLKAGGAYLPLEPELPAARLAYMAEDSQASIMLVQAGREGAAAAIAPDAVVVPLDEDGPGKKDQPDNYVSVASDPEDLAYVIYTSGSTGKPKGVMIPHKGMRNRLLWMRDEFHVSRDDRILQKTPFGFDVSVWEIFLPLVTGARLVLAGPDDHRDVVSIRRVIDRESVSVLHFVPSLLRMFLESVVPGESESLRAVICSGEVLPKSVQQAFFSKLSGQLSNLYGPTEASIDVTYWHCREDDVRRTVPIGRPIANTEMYVLDPTNEPCPVGVSGELFIGGDGLARGYINQPDLTRKRFVESFFCPGEKLYKTGDVGRWVEDGVIEFVGRTDSQVQIRGERIELGEIEACLCEHPDVEAAAVVVVADTAGFQRLVAYVTPARNRDKTDLRKFLRSRLPETMIPQRMVHISELPLTHNGKADRSVLAKRAQARHATASSREAAQMRLTVWPAPSTATVKQERAIQDVALPISAELVRAVAKTARGLGIGADRLYLCAFVAYLSRVTGETTIAFAIPAAHEDGESPSFVAVDVDQADGFGDFARAMVVAEFTPDGAFDQGATSPIYLDVANHSDEYDSSFVFCLHIAREQEKTSLRAAFQLCDHDAGLVELRLREYLQLITSAAANPGVPICRLEILPVDERDMLIHRWNPVQTDYPRSRCVHELVEDCARRTPDAVAVISESGRYTYGELDHRASFLARQLTRAGAAPGTLVGICTDRSVDMVAGVLAILKVGGAYVPLDPLFPQARVDYMLHDAGISVLLTQRSLLPRVGRELKSIVCLDEGLHSGAQASGPAEGRDRESHADALAYVTYTSGSTGDPKGVQITHRSVVNFLVGMRDVLGVTPDERVAALTTLSFDISVLEVLLPLVCGARVVVLERGTAFDGNRLSAKLEESGISLMQATPGVWRNLVRSGWTGASNLTVLCGGEPFPLDIKDELLQRCRAVWNMYGPTETTVWSSCERLGSRGEEVTIGRPIANTRIHIVDLHGQLTPLGVEGEICIAGDGVSTGYLNRPEFTAERFVADPFSPDKDARMYRTGDRGVLLSDGRIRCLGRSDNQVKLNGYRVELEEIEARICRHGGVAAAAAKVAKNRRGERELVAYVVRAPTEHCSLRALRAYLRENLPFYMLPRHIVELQALPAMPNGKIDRQALASAPSSEEGAVEHSPTLGHGDTGIERTIREIWCDVLGLSEIPIHMGFFEIGGNSLLASQLVARLGKRLKMPIPLGYLFVEPTLAGFSRLLRDRLRWPTSHRTVGGGSLASFAMLFPVQPLGHRPPLFLVAGAHGSSYAFSSSRDVSRGYEDDFFRYLSNIIPFLGADQPIFAFRPKGLAFGEMPHSSVETMAAAYLRRMEERQPTGPYYIGGECVGGVVAYEMARQLRAQGKNVGLLVLMDTWHPGVRRTVHERFVTNRRRIARIGRTIAREIVSSGCGEKAIWVRRRLHRVLHRVAPVTPKMRMVRRALRASDTYAKTLHRYHPLPSTGAMTLIVNSAWHSVCHSLGWGEGLVDDLTIRAVSGDHVSRLAKHAAVMGRCVREVLDGAISGAAGTDAS